MKTLLLNLLFISIFTFHVHSSNVEETYNEILNLYQEFGESDYIGEPVSQIEHALQCALLAENDLCDEDIVLASLLHDIGHLILLKNEGFIGEYGGKDHEKVGADYLLSVGFSQRLSSIISGHVNAKRYLAYKNPEFLKLLSFGSFQSLKTQGWIMTSQEALEFEKHPLFMEFLSLRNREDNSKTPGRATKQLEDYREMILSHLENEAKLKALN